ncbi:MAG: diphthamide biosynthesis enzyme Dph2 [Theionarchaea archaeon]|nr:diphthamide biosynthesis enzyme Dph2 [Theionarchaea archaeon]
MLVIDEQELLQQVEKHKNVCEITVQAPEGLKRRALEIAGFLENEGYTVFISADPCYGACDLKVYGDLLIHVGHTEIYPPQIPAIFVNVYDDFDFIPVLKKTLHVIPRTVGLLTTAQHRQQLPKVFSFLEENGIQPVLGRGVRTQFEGQILGCDLTAAVCIQDKVEAFLYLGTGVFHPLGAALATRKNVFCVYNQVEKVDPQKLLRKRHALIFAASLGHTFGIIMSTKRGQLRKKEALKIREYLKKKGKTTYMFIADEIRPEILYGCDAYVICACPRIALDDALKFDNPVLTCKEVELMFEEKEYEMDMIV